jgi:tetratricopeptide (TPR) repeat protein
MTEPDLKTITLKCAKCGIDLSILPEIEAFACAACGTQQVVQRIGGIVSLKPGGEAGGVRIGTAPTIGKTAMQCLRLVGAAIKAKTNAVATAVKDTSKKMKTAGDAAAVDPKRIKNYAAALVIVFLFVLIAVIILFSNGMGVAALVVIALAIGAAHWTCGAALRACIRLLVSEGIRRFKAVKSRRQASQAFTNQPNNLLLPQSSEALPIQSGDPPATAPTAITRAASRAAPFVAAISKGISKLFSGTRQEVPGTNTSTNPVGGDVVRDARAELQRITESFSPQRLESPEGARAFIELWDRGELKQLPKLEAAFNGGARTSEIISKLDFYWLLISRAVGTLEDWEKVDLAYSKLRIYGPEKFHEHGGGGRWIQELEAVTNLHKQMVEQAARSEPFANALQRATALTERGWLALKLGDFGVSSNRFECALILNPNDHSAITGNAQATLDAVRWATQPQRVAEGRLKPEDKIAAKAELEKILQTLAKARADDANDQNIARYKEEVRALLATL